MARPLHTLSKNDSGNPILRVRENISFDYRGSHYSTIHVYGNLSYIRFSLRTGNWKDSCVGGGLYSKGFRQEELIRTVKELVEGYQVGSPPSWAINLKKEVYDSVLV
jgi:hypothetical protein